MAGASWGANDPYADEAPATAKPPPNTPAAPATATPATAPAAAQAAQPAAATVPWGADDQVEGDAPPQSKYLTPKVQTNSLGLNLDDINITNEDLRRVATGIVAGLSDVPEALSRLMQPGRDLTEKVVDSYPTSDYDIFEGRWITPDEVKQRVQKYRESTRLDASGLLARYGIIDEAPGENATPFERGTYNFGRNVGSSLPAAPIVGILPAIIGAGGATVAGETAHHMGASPEGEALASVAGGAVSTLAMPTAGAGVRTGKAAIRPLSSEGRNLVVGNALNRSSGGRPVTVTRNPIDMPRTMGQATNDPGILALEKSVAKSDPENQGTFLTLKSDQNRAIIAKARELASDQTVEHGNAQVRVALDRALQASNAREGQLWDGIDPHGQVTVSPNLVGEVVGGFEAALPIADRGTIPPWVGNVVRQMNERGRLSLGEVIAFDKRLGREVRAAQGQERYILGDLQRQVRNALGSEDLFSQINDPQALGRWQEARAFTANQKTIFDNNPFVSRAIADARGGAPAVQESQLLAHFVRKNGGSAEAIDSLINSTADEAGNIHPGVRQSVRDYIVDNLLRASNKAELDQAGHPVMNDAKMRDFVRLYEQPMRRVFRSDERALINRLVQAAETMNRTTRAGYKGGSDTYSMFSGSRFVDRILEHTLTNEKGGIVPGASGGAALGWGLGGPVGAGVGAVGGVLTRGAYLRAQAQIETLMRAALTDPDLARALMTKASTKNLEALRPAVRAYFEQLISGVAGAQTQSTQRALPAPVSAGGDKKRVASRENLTAPKSAAERDALRPGERYIDPEGVVRVRQ